MAKPECDSVRDSWWEDRIESAPSLKGKVYLLRDKVLADIARLPEGAQEGALDFARTALQDLLCEIEIRRREERWTVSQ
ncbi:hypothetical protein [Streptomyces cucumeris]|uniref:hypothetical protein n=1 Tax=Streptomyces cucumeris TaxID=2962890 RepID=UPI0020C8D8A2|nr:hypothetical protein [Streptomyces sp. NEAU-Y11]MCP9209640.1 hypothetical protein [Streptomyces sp. NEAU-Y11]